jgi:hypothetical protein
MIAKKNADVQIHSNCCLNIQASKESNRIYNLCPGFEALPIYVSVETDEETNIRITVK